MLNVSPMAVSSCLISTYCERTKWLIFPWLLAINSALYFRSLLLVSSPAFTGIDPISRRWHRRRGGWE